MECCRNYVIIRVNRKTTEEQRYGRKYSVKPKCKDS